MTKLKELRIAAGMSQSALAEAAEVNVKVLQHYEQGTKNFDNAKLSTIARICSALNCRLIDVIENPECVKALKKLPK